MVSEEFAEHILQPTAETQQFRVLEQTHWKGSGKNGASEILGLNVSTLRARMRKLGIRRP
jgi:transcriptional regulator with GAF, ATPase, and Fis domain